MRRTILAFLAFLLFSIPAFAGGLDNFMANLNIQAGSNMRDFSARLSAQFGIPEAQVSAVIGSVREPAEAFMVLQLGQWAQYPPERALHVYEAERNNGWGAMAKSMGIKPGSAQFHALKSGNLTFSGRPHHDRYDDHGKVKGKDKGKKKDKHKGKDKKHKD